jgi:hypothetical protein
MRSVQIWLRLDRVADRAGNAAQRAQVTLGVHGRPGVKDGDVDDRASGELRRVVLGRQRELDAERGPDGIGPGQDELAVALGQLLRPLDRMHDHAVRDRAIERMEPELERGHDPEVRAGAADAPEELRMLVLAGADQVAVGRDQLDGEEVVDRQPEPTLQPAHAAAEGQPPDAGVRDHADRADEAVLLCRVVELGQQRAATDTRGARSRLDLGAAHP